MTLLTGRLTRRRPRPTTRFSRAQLQQAADAYRQQRDRAIGQRRATLDWIGSWLEGRASAFDQEAAHLDRLRPVTAKASTAPEPMTAKGYRQLAGELRDCIRDFDRGTR
jgi:hypothetical protein